MQDSALPQPCQPPALERISTLERRVNELESRLNDTNSEFNLRLCNLEETLGIANPATPQVCAPRG